jgi:hypothetical protein
MTLGEGTWTSAGGDDTVPASVEASFTRTRVDARLYPTAPHQRQAAHAPPALSPADVDALASQPWYPNDMWRRELEESGAVGTHAPIDALLEPGDFVVAVIPAGAILEVMGPTESSR